MVEKRFIREDGKGRTARRHIEYVDDFSDFWSNEKSIKTTIFTHKRSISSSDLDSTHSFPTFYRINIDWGLNYDAFMTMYGLHKNI